MIVVNTENGSRYLIDTKSKTWKRVVAGKLESNNPLRTKFGMYTTIDIELGHPMNITCPPITEGTSFRLISTSPIVGIEYPDVIPSLELDNDKDCMRG